MFGKPVHAIVSIGSIIVSQLIAIGSIDAQELANLHVFGLTNSVVGGRMPKAGLVVGSDGNLYGTTYSGGAAMHGSVFNVTTAGTGTILYSFGATAGNDGLSPTHSLIQAPDGNFYGTTEYGGTAGYGTVFRITPSGQETVLHSFKDGSVANDGEYPDAALVQGTDGYLYGTTFEGGSTTGRWPNGFGTVFRISVSGQVTILHSFNDGSVPDDGSWPHAGLVEGPDGNYYGVANGSFGVVYQITPNGVVTIIYHFGTVTNDGYDPECSLALGTDGNLYGTTLYGGSASYSGNGTVFKMTLSGQETILHSFTSSNPIQGANPDASLVEGSDGSFYSTTQGGGSAALGTIYRVNSAGHFSIVHSFKAGAAAGAIPVSNLVRTSDGTMYGATTVGGSNGDGAVYSVTDTGIYHLLYSFEELKFKNDGLSPIGALATGPDGAYYGVTSQGGAVDEGAAFTVTASGKTTILHSFGDGTVKHDGQGPESGLTLGSDGNFYGTTWSGGAATDGVVFQMTPLGKVTILHSFNDGTVANDGLDPYALVQGPDDNLYGTTNQGGTAGYGTVYQISYSGAMSILHSFGDGSVAHDGTEPAAGLTLGQDGNFYGTTTGGGGVGEGNVFRITPAGVESVVYAFEQDDKWNDGTDPAASLMQAANGTLYGTTQTGGTGYYGTVFSVNAAGVETVLHSFDDGSIANDGQWPLAAVIQGSDGNFYGTTVAGVNSGGIVYRITPSGEYTILHAFNGLVDGGAGPRGSVSEGTDGNLYGTTSDGGLLGNGGTVFELTTELPVITSFTPNAGAAHTSVVITGSNFTGATEVTFNSVPAHFTVLSKTRIRALVPKGATTGTIAVTTRNGTTTSATSFTVP